MTHILIIKLVKSVKAILGIASVLFICGYNSTPVLPKGFDCDQVNLIIYFPIILPLSIWHLIVGLPYIHFG